MCAQKGAAGLVLAVERVEAPRRPVVSKSGCDRAQRAGSAQDTAPRALHRSMVMLGCFWHQPGALTCHPRRAHPATLAAEGVLKARDSRRWPAAMTPRNGGLTADDAVASHSAADGGGPSMDGARTHAGGISRGAAARCPAFRSAILSKSAFWRADQQWEAVWRIILLRQIRTATRSNSKLLRSRSNATFPRQHRFVKVVAGVIIGEAGSSPGSESRWSFFWWRFLVCRGLTGVLRRGAAAEGRA